MRKLVIGASVSAMLFSATTVSAEILGNYHVGNWLIGAYSNDQTKQFTHCATSSVYASGITMLFAVTQQYQWNIGFAHPAWALTPGAVIPLVFTIDNHAPITAQAVAINSTQVAAQLASSAPLFQAFRRGRQLKVYAVNQVFPFNLDATSAVLPALLNCVAQHSKPPHFASPSNQITYAPQSSQQTASSNNRAESTALIANVLGHSGISNFEIMDPNEIPSGANIDVMWRSGSISGALTVIAPDGVTKVTDLPGWIISDRAKSCKGKFFSASMPDNNSEGPVAHVTTSCQIKSETMTAYYVGVPRDKGGYYLFATITTGAQQINDEQEPIKQADSNICAAVHKVLSK